MKNLLCVDVFEGIDYDRLFYMVKEIGFDGLFSGEIHGDALRSVLKKVNDNKKPHWIGSYAPYRCDQCGKHSDSMTNFCWNCGADMRE